MKYKEISKNYLKVCLDRLTRFKPVGDRYERVFFDIVSKYAIADIKKGQSHELYDREQISKIAVDIFNNSIPFEYDSYISNLLKKEACDSFFLNNDEKNYLDLKLNLTGAIKYIDSDKLPLNLLRLKYLEKNRQVSSNDARCANSFLYPVKKVVLAEGATEEILLSEFASILGNKFEASGIYLIGAGGKNQVARKYYKMADEIKLPIFILLDNDAIETKALIDNKLRSQDRVYIIKSGEFEDILPLNLIINAVNENFRYFHHCNEFDFDKTQKMTKNLHDIFKAKGFGEFKKAEFAKIIYNYLCKENNTEVSNEIKTIISMIEKL